jgi:hypothetical protein
MKMIKIMRISEDTPFTQFTLLTVQAILEYVRIERQKHGHGLLRLQYFQNFLISLRMNYLW